MALKIQHILFPVDFSPQCVETSTTVKSWAHRLGAKVTLLHAFESFAAYTPETASMEAEMQLLSGLARQRLAQFLTEDWGSLEVERVLEEGSAASAIVAYAHGHAVDLIMMPTQGHSRFRQLLLGSVTASVLHDSEVPVWTSAHLANPGQHEEPRRIVCALDCGPETTKVVSFALDIASRFGAELTAMYANEAVGATFESGIAQGAHRFVVEQAKQAYALATVGIDNAPLLEVFENGPLVDVVRQLVVREKADLLIIGRGRTQEFLGRLRSNAHDLIRMSGCPVMSI